MEVPAEEFYADLRVGQRARDLSLLAIVLVAIAGLAIVNHRRERALRRSEARLDALLQNAHDVVVVVDERGRASFISSAVHRLLGYEVADRLGIPLADLAHPDDHDRLITVIPAVVDHGEMLATDVRLRDASGRYHWYDIDAVDRRDDPHIGGLLLTCHDVSDRKELQDQLAHRARHDPLTGLANRATLTDRLQKLAEDTDPEPFAVLFIDLDHFKPVNDTLGHDAGDEVLRVIAQRFRSQVRGDGEHDGADLVCRLGGDEFAVVLGDASELIARQTAERLLDAARQPIVVGDRTVQISATIGVSLSSADAGTPDEAMRDADRAMYQAKEAGRGTIGTARPPETDLRSPLRQ
jgi:diguanylate cyclase (GGDEF)-like protein/PAS domain S-box-containing protein